MPVMLLDMTEGMIYAYPYKGLKAQLSERGQASLRRASINNYLTPKGDRHVQNKGLMQADIDPLVAAEPKLGKIDVKHFVSDRYLKKLGRIRLRAKTHGAVEIWD